MDETLSEPEEDMDIGATPAGEIVPGNLSAEKWVDTATPPLGSLQKNLELQLRSKPLDIGMVFSSNVSKKKNTFVENKTNFLNALDKEVELGRVLDRVQ